MTMWQVVLSLVWIAAFCTWGWACYLIGRTIERSERYYAMARKAIRQRPEPDPDIDPRDPNVIALRKRSL